MLKAHHTCKLDEIVIILRKILVNNTRRDFLKKSAVITATAAISQTFANAAKQNNTAELTINPKNPLYRGFNLLDMFTMRSKGDFSEDDFRYIRDWGFNFVRLPLCYRLWINDGDDYKINNAMLEKLDRAVGLGGKYGIHMSLNFHRGPGYSVNREFTEPHNLWKDKSALDAFCFHWQMLAKRYNSISSEKLSFNLINEPTGVGKLMSRKDHNRVITKAVKTIRKVSADRMISIDGLSWGQKTVPELADLNIGQSTRAYEPFKLTHYKASWANSKGWPEPVWPKDGPGRKRLEEMYKPWADLAKQGVHVHCGEGGCHNRTPHKVVIPWLRDVLEVLNGYKIGFALWNLRGSFGVLDSARTDVDYEDFHGHKLDRKMLELLTKY